MFFSLSNLLFIFQTRPVTDTPAGYDVAERGSEARYERRWGNLKELKNSLPTAQQPAK